MELMTEVLASVVRCQANKVKTTVGQVERHLINIRVSRRIVQITLSQLQDWGLVECKPFQYRKNVTSCDFRICQKQDALKLVIAMIKWDDDLKPHFLHIMDGGE